jgi:hypothetical protein
MPSGYARSSPQALRNVSNDISLSSLCLLDTIDKEPILYALALANTGFHAGYAPHFA